MNIALQNADLLDSICIFWYVPSVLVNQLDMIREFITVSPIKRSHRGPALAKTDIMK